jgi:hypothetical protein
MKLIEIFRTGKHTAMNGQTLSFGEAELRATVAAYDPALHEAPVVVGHPASDQPAYGWIRALTYADGHLSAEPHQVDPAFAELVAAGRFKKVSAAFYTPDAPNNPKPGVYYLRHVGFLGAQAPAVKGLRGVQFSDDGQGVVVFGDWEDRAIPRLFRQLRDFLIGEFGQEKADKALATWDIETLEQRAAQPGTQAYTEPEPKPATEQPTMKPEELAAKEKAISDKEAAFAEREKQIAAQEAKQRQAETAVFLDGLVKQGKLLPAWKPGLAAFFETIHPATGVVAFGEGDGRKEQAPVVFFREFLTGMPKLVEYQEIAKAGEPPAADPNAIAMQAVAYQEEMRAKGVTVSVVDAVAHVSKPR